MSKSIKVETIVKYVNTLLATHGEDENPQYVTGYQDLCEWILIESGEYKGVRHLTIDEVPKGCKPGIRNGPTLKEQFNDIDPNRVQYLLTFTQ